MPIVGKKFNEDDVDAVVVSFVVLHSEDCVPISVLKLGGRKEVGEAKQD